MSPAELQQFLHRNVPLSLAMQVGVDAIDAAQLVLSAPLPPNLNQHGTAFGGSAATLGVLAAWSLLHTRLTQLVVQRSAMEYEAPMSGRFTATATLSAEADWDRFLVAYASHGKARIQVQAVLHSTGQRAGLFSGEFVAVREAVASEAP